MHVILWETAKGTVKVIQTTQEYVAVSIYICPWQISMRLGIKVKVTPCDTPGYIQYVNCVHISCECYS